MEKIASSKISPEDIETRKKQIYIAKKLKDCLATLLLSLLFSNTISSSYIKAALFLYTRCMHSIFSSKNLLFSYPYSA